MTLVKALTKELAKALAKAYGITTETWNYVPPEKGKSKHKIIPLPNDVYFIIHYTCSKNSYENALYQYLFYHGFLIGLA